MKMLTTSALALCLLILVGCAEGNAPDAEAANVISAANNKVEANISGMDCSGCSGSIIAAVEGIDGVTACMVDLKSGDVSVALTDEADAGEKMLEVEKTITSLSDGKFSINSLTVSHNTEHSEVKTCPAGCTKDCCKQAEGDDVIEAIKAEVEEVTKDIEVPALGGE